MQENKDSCSQQKKTSATWRDFYRAETKQEKEAILQKIYKGSLTQEEIDILMS